jgi:hypothetical protein
MIKFCWHKWGRWSKGIESYGGSIHQVCECEKCGAIKRRLAISIGMAQLGAGQVNEAIKGVNK